MLEDVIVAVNADMAARGILNAQGTALVCAMGGDELSQHLDAPPRIIITPTRDPFTGPRKLGGNPRQLFCRSAGADVEIWGVGSDGTAMGDYAATAKLLHDFIVSLRHVGFADFELSPATWNRRRGNNTTLGRVVVLPILVHIPVVDTTLSTARITHGRPRATHVDPRPTRAPSITSVAPATVALTGGAITIHGARFSLSPVVLVGGAAASSIVRVSDVTVTCVAPPHADARVDVEVINADGLTATSESALRYHDTGSALPVMTSVAPDLGSAGGGTAITITGSHLTGVTSVTIGGHELAAFNVVDDDTITGVTAAAPAGALLTVSVTSPGGSASIDDAYSYLPAGYVLALLADNATLDGLGKVATWPDVSGNGHTYHPGPAPAPPGWSAEGLNGRPTVDFDGSSSEMLIATGAPYGTDALTQVVVVRPGSNPANSFIVGRRYLALSYSLDYSSGDRIVATTTGTGAVSNASIAGAPHILVQSWDRTANAGSVDLFVDGAAQASHGAALAPIGAGLPPDLNAIGGASNGTYGPAGAFFWTGSIAAYFVWPTALSDPDRIVVETYLRHRYATP